MADQLNPKTVLVNGAELTYVEKGAGEPVIFVHGSLGDYRSWLPQVEAFSPRYQAISYSRRYHYPNPWIGDGTDYTVSRHVEDLITLIETLGLGPANVVGNSFGAYTTLIAAIRRPNLIRKLVIGEPPILPWLQEIHGGQEYFDRFMSQTWLPATEAFKSGNLEQGVRLFIDGVSGKGDFDRLPAPVKNRQLENATSLKAETTSPDYFTPITTQQIQQIELPILLLKGEHSPKMFHLIVDRIAPCVKNLHQATIPDASHSMAAGNPTAYNQVVLSFL